VTRPSKPLAAFRDSCQLAARITRPVTVDTWHGLIRADLDTTSITIPAPPGTAVTGPAAGGECGNSECARPASHLTVRADGAWMLCCPEHLQDVLTIALGLDASPRLN
jgi:hypothetical protein